MKLRVGYELQYAFPQPTPAILMLNIHFSRVAGLRLPTTSSSGPPVPISGYRDGFGNWCCRIVAPKGKVSISANAVVPTRGMPIRSSQAAQDPVEDCPKRHSSSCWAAATARATCCSTGLEAVRPRQPGWGRVQAICDFVHKHIEFGYEHARVTRTASEAYAEKRGVCRDYAHLAIAFCRALNIPARYCTGYLGDVGMPPPYPPGDFAAWFEAYLGGHWHTFDPRNNVPRIGRVLIARGRDAADVAITTTFGPNTLESFKVWTDEVDDAPVRVS